MRKFDLSLRSSRSSYFATFRHQLTILSKTDALDEEKWLNMLGTFVKDWFRSEERFSRNAETDLVCRLLLEKKNNNPCNGIFVHMFDGCNICWDKGSRKVAFCINFTSIVC